MNDETAICTPTPATDHAIRPATPSDLADLVAMGQRFRAATAYRESMVESPAQLRATAARLLAGADSVILVTEAREADGTQRLTGMMGLVVYPHFISGRRVCGEVFWWIEPEARGIGLPLLRAAQAWAAERGAEQLHLSAADERSAVLYARLGYRPLERSFYAPIVPIWPYPVEGIHVFDDVLRDPVAYRATALTQAFRDETDGAITFHGITTAPSSELLQWIRTQCPTLAPDVTFLRQSPAGQVEPHFVHSDRSMGEWSGILYLTPDPPADDGTTFWRDRDSGATSSTTRTPEGYAAEGAQWAERARWTPWYHVPARFNRLLLFQSALFHSRAIEANYGEGEAARLIQVVFGRVCA